MVRRIAILCSGQGLQHPDMFESLRKYDPCASLLADFLTRQLLAPELTAALQSGRPIAPDILFDNRHAQPLICLYQLMVWAKISPALGPDLLFAGYSVGEPIAYGCAGLFALEDTIELVRERAAAMTAAGQACGPGAMLAVKGLALPILAELVEQAHCHIAIYNPGNHFIVGGLRDNIDQLETACAAHGAAKAVRLSINIAAHTPLLRAAADRFQSALQTVSYHPNPAVVMLEGITGRRIFTGQQACRALATQIYQPVRWERNIDAMLEYGCETFLELGPGRALANMINARIDHGNARAIDEFSNLDELAGWVQSKSGR